jgi:hypothetical protein
MKRLLLAAIATLVAGCAYPVSTVQQGAEQSALFVPNAPAGAVVEVDGMSLGAAIAADGKKPAILPVTAGKHRVVVRGVGGPLFDKDIYVGAGSKVAVELAR